MNEYHNDRNEFCRKALGVDSLANLPENGMHAAWQAYDHNPRLADEDRAQAVREAVAHHDRGLNALTPTVDGIALSDGGEVTVEWTESDTGAVHFLSTFAHGGVDTAALVDEIELTSINQVRAMIDDLQRVADGWEWLDTQRMRADVADAQSTLRRREAR